MAKISPQQIFQGSKMQKSNLPALSKSVGQTTWGRKRHKTRAQRTKQTKRTTAKHLYFS